VDEEGRMTELSAATHVSPATLLHGEASQHDSLKFAGGGAHAHKELIRSIAGEEKIILSDEGRDAPPECVDGTGAERVWRLAREADDYATEIARLGLISYEEGATVDAHVLAASYLRPSDAELNR
jgi:hypothetical protein